MEKQTRTLPTGTLVKRFLPYFAKHKKTVAFDLCCAALTKRAEVRCAALYAVQLLSCRQILNVTI